MPFIGNQPAKVPLTSADITDGIITNADIANSTINLTQKVTGSLPVANGGTGLTALGSSLQVLRTNTGATALEFATISTGATAGQVIQVVSATDTTARTTTSSTFGANGTSLSVAITPSASANKILVLVNAGVGYPDGNSVSFSVFRGATNLGNGNSGFLLLPRSDDQGDDACGWSVAYLDSPSTTSSTTYEVRFRASGGIIATLNYSNATGNLTLMEIKG